jgi:hypothetical protein
MTEKKFSEREILIAQIREEAGEFLPDDWDDDEIIVHALRFMVANLDAVEQGLFEEDDDWDDD